LYSDKSGIFLLIFAICKIVEINQSTKLQKGTPLGETPLVLPLPAKLCLLIISKYKDVDDDNDGKVFLMQKKCKGLMCMLVP
jgi:hypothetical protein